MKGRSVQYHSNISKDEGRIFYEKFITLCEVFLFLLLHFSTMWGMKITTPIFVEHVIGMECFGLNCTHGVYN